MNGLGHERDERDRVGILENALGVQAVLCSDSMVEEKSLKRSTSHTLTFRRSNHAHIPNRQNSQTENVPSSSHPLILSHTNEQLAQDLLVLGAVTLRPNNPFTWASGMKAPIYCDNRLTMGDMAVRRRITDGFAALVKQFGSPPDVVAGTAMAGIPHAAWLAERLELPMVYVRSQAKAHGRENLIEGSLKEGSRVVLVEDTISTGGSSLAAVRALREEGADVEAVLAIYTYGFGKAKKAFEEDGVPLHTLTDYDALIKAAAEMQRLNDEDVETLKAWRDGVNAEG